MGRKKVEMKRIEDKSSRQVTFSKRRSGLIKKASELSILCDVSVGLIIFSSRGKLYEFSNGNRLAQILERYQSQSEEEATASEDVNAANFHSEYVSFCSHAELLEMVQSQLEEPNVEQLSLTDLVQVEKQLDTALSQTRARKTELMMESLMTLREKERLLKEENELLEKEIGAMEKKGGVIDEVAVGFGKRTTLRLL